MSNRLSEEHEAVARASVKGTIAGDLAGRLLDEIDELRADVQLLQVQLNRSRVQHVAQVEYMADEAAVIRKERDAAWKAHDIAKEGGQILADAVDGVFAMVVPSHTSHWQSLAAARDAWAKVIESA